MDRIAIISDIHGNIPALKAVFQDINDRNVERIICLGDMVGKGPYPEIALDMVRKNCKSVVKGNWDDLMLSDSNKEMTIWNQNRLGRDRIEYIRSLPLFVDIKLSGKLIRLCHAAPTNVNNRVYSTDSETVRMSLFDPVGVETESPDIIGYGDIHGAYIMSFRGKTLFNTGSVGNPLDITLSSYVIIEGNSCEDNIKPISIQFVRVPYDVEMSIKQAKDEKMPCLEPYIKELRTAEYRGKNKE